MIDGDQQPPLPEPEYFEYKRTTAIAVEKIDVAINKAKTRVMIALADPESGISIVFPTSAPGARQLAAYILNKADLLDEENQ